ncbi:MAG: dethiobiotin synthase [Methylococcales bacterium]|nr:dethiobiotin synthase [Methylococcales bacterium]
MKYGFFITGTDTGVGKTWATIALMRRFKQQELSVVGMKPVAAGCEYQDGQLKNEDALLIQENASQWLDYSDINPYAFEDAISPHLAGVEYPVQIDVIAQAFDKIKDKADVILVEGAGGWFAPLNNEDDIADLAKALALPVIVVVAIRLGCINHARLTLQAIQSAGVHCVGWIAMCIDPKMARQDENIATIKNKSSAPLLGVLPYTDEMNFDYLAENLTAEKLI